MNTRRKFLKLMGKAGLLVGVTAAMPATVIAKSIEVEGKKLPTLPPSVPAEYWDRKKGEVKTAELIKDYIKLKDSKK